METKVDVAHSLEARNVQNHQFRTGIDQNLIQREEGDADAFLSGVEQRLDGETLPHGGDIQAVAGEVSIHGVAGRRTGVSKKEIFLCQILSCDDRLGGQRMVPVADSKEYIVDLPRPRKGSDPDFIKLRNEVTDLIKWW